MEKRAMKKEEEEERRTKLSNQVSKIKAKKLFFLTKERILYSIKLILAKILLQHFLNHKVQQTGTYNC